MSQKVFCKECNLVYNEKDIERLHKISNLSNLNLPNFKPNTANFVLSNFNANEKECLKEILKYAKNGLLELVKSNINEISAKFNTKNCLKD